jgi:hypothetical protein
VPENPGLVERNWFGNGTGHTNVSQLTTLIKITEDFTGSKEKRNSGCSVLKSVAFDDIGGKPLAFLKPNRPFKRCLCLHAKIIRLTVIERSWAGAQEWDIDSSYTRDDLNLDVAKFMSEVSRYTMSRRGSIDLSQNSGHDSNFNICKGKERGQKRS